jgi:tetratricopeptide (TPR) repeat protein
MANKSSSKPTQHSKSHEKDFKDQLLEQPFIHKVMDWVTQNLKIIGIVAGVVILVLIVGSITLNYQKGQAQKASALEGKAIQLHQDAQEAASSAGEEDGSEEADKLYQESISTYKQLLDEYSGSPSAERALFLLGSLESERENYAEAREYFSSYIKKYADGPLALSAKESLAYIFEQEGDYQKAIESFKELEKSVSDAKKADIQLALARNYRSFGQKEEAAKIYQSIMDSSTSVAVKNQASEALEIVKSDQEFPPPAKEEATSSEAEESVEAEAAPEVEVVEEAQPEVEATPEAEMVEEAQPEVEATPEAKVVEEAQPEAEATPETEVVEEAQPEAEATPEIEVVEEAQPEVEVTPEAEIVEEAQPETEATPETEVVEEAQPEAEATPEAEVVEEAPPEDEASPVAESTPVDAESEDAN